MTKLSRFRVHPAKSEEGVWFDFELHSFEPMEAPHAVHLSVLVARYRNPKHRAREAELLEVHVRNGHVADGFRRAVDRALADTVLLGWENLDGDDGNPIPFSAEKAHEILTDPANDVLRQFVIDAACRSSGYRQEAEEAARGN
jgi:hypothetical protein